MKLFAIGLACMWSIGALTGYFIAKWDFTTSPKPIALVSKQADMRNAKSQPSRNLLESQHRLCGGKADVSKISDGNLKEIVESLCLEKS